MSIINDALKKAQNRMNQEKSNAPLEGAETHNPQTDNSTKLGDERFARPAQQAETPQPKQPAKLSPAAKPQSPPRAEKQSAPRKGSAKKWLGISIGLVLLMTAGSLWFFNLLPFSAENSHTAGTQNRPQGDGGLHLSGIMTMGEKRVALINDDIYELGDIVAGKRIVEIERDKVHLADQDQNISIIKVFGN